MNRHVAIAVALALLALPAVAAAHVGDVTTVSFDYPLPGHPTEVSGSFSFDASKTGVVGLGDLITFDVTYDSTAFHLADILGFNTDVNFGWNVSRNAFVPTASDVPSPDYSYVGKDYVIAGFRKIGTNYESALYLPAVSYPSSIYTLAAIVPNEGYVFTPVGPVGFVIESVLTAPGQIPDTPPPAPGVPEPAAWATMLLGLGLTGSVVRRRRRTLAAA